MSTRAEQFAGLSVAMVTPFRDGAVDFDALDALEQVDPRRTWAQIQVGDDRVRLELLKG